jgi:uncharacterized protein YrrD
MKNVNNDIMKFDGKYLKCIVSKYKAITKYLANSGALIILQPNSEQINKDIVETYDSDTNTYSISMKTIDSQKRNYIYLGDEFLASGYGFSTIQYRDSAERIIRNYDKDIQDIKTTIKEEIEERGNIDEEIQARFDAYVEKDGGRINDTCLELPLANSENTIKIPTKYIILYGEEAKYDNLELINFTISITGPSQYFVHNKVNYYNENTILCPIGSILNYVSISMETDDKDSGGLSSLRVNHNKVFNNDETSETENEEELVDSIIINYDYDYDYRLNDNFNVSYKHHMWGYKKLFSNNFVVTNDIENLVKNVYLDVKGTPVAGYKYYPGLFAHNNDWKIISSGNAIKDNVIELNKSINLKPQYYGRYSSSINGSNYYDTINNCFALNSFKENDTTNIIFDIPTVNGSLTKTIYIEIPNNFSITKLYLLSNDNSAKYNISGVLKVYKNKNRICQYANTYIKHNSETGEDENYVSTIAHDIYCLTLDNAEFNNVNKININVIYNNTDNNVNETNVNELNNDLGYSWDIINDEEFNLLYWINGHIDSEEYNINDLKSMIEHKAKNGIIKT